MISNQRVLIHCNRFGIEQSGLPMDKLNMQLRQLFFIAAMDVGDIALPVLHECLPVVLDAT